MAQPSGIMASIECRCGARWTGQRAREAQIVDCAACRRPLFVFGFGPWQEPRSPVLPGPARRERGAYVPALIATLLLLAGFLLAFLEMRPAPPAAMPDQRVALEAALGQSERWLGQGEFSRAARRLAEMADLAPEEWLDVDQAARWRRARDEASLFADLLAEPLEDLLHHASTGSEEEWLESFARRYCGKAVIFDAEFEPSGAEWKCDYTLARGDGVLSFQGVKLFERVSDRKKQRLIVGMRLASICFEAPGPAWVVRFAADGGVFLTYPEAAAHACPPLAAPDALVVLKRQAAWTR